MRYRELLSHARYWGVFKRCIAYPPAQSAVVYENITFIRDWGIRASTQALSDIVKVPLYKEKIARNEDATAPYSRVGSKVERVSEATVYATRNTASFTWVLSPYIPGIGRIYQKVIVPDVVEEVTFSGDLLGDWGEDRWSLAATACTLSGLTAENKAKTAFLAEIRETETQFNGLMAIKTLQDTWHGIRHPAEALVTGYKKWRSSTHTLMGGLRNNLKSISKELHAVVTGSWLEFQFSMSPTYDDIISASEAIAEVVNRVKPEVVRVKGFGIESYEKSEVFNLSFTILPGNVVVSYRLTVTTQETVSVNISGACRTHFANEVDRDMKVLGLTHKQVTETAWDAIPFSFLAGYFLNIGDVIESMGTAMASLLWSSKTTVVRRNVTVRSQITSLAPNFIIKSAGCGEYVYSYVNMKRERIVDFSPKFEFSLPDLGSKRWLNMLALVRFR